MVAERGCGETAEVPCRPGCIALLEGRDVDDGLLIALGLGGQAVLTDGPRQRNQYWRRVWAARGLLHVWDAKAATAIIAATADEHWRVREMAAKVIARYRVDAGLEAVAELRADPVCRGSGPRRSGRRCC
jgi:hypothetical protein